MAKHIFSILHKWGIHTLGEFAALEKDEIGLRLGPEAVHMWERAQGKTTRLLELTQPSESFEESFEFENEIETMEPLLFVLRRFLQQLSLRLERPLSRGQGIDAIRHIHRQKELRALFYHPGTD